MEKKQNKKQTAFYAAYWKVTQQSSYVNRNPDLFSAFCVRISHELLWHRKSVFYTVRILIISYFIYFLKCPWVPLNRWTFQILRYTWHFHVFVSQKFIYNKIGIRRKRLKHRPNKMIRQSVRTLFWPSGGPSHCPSVNSFIHPSIQTSEQLSKKFGSKPLQHNTDFTAIVIIDNWQLLNKINSRLCNFVPTVTD